MIVGMNLAEIEWETFVSVVTLVTLGGRTG